MIEAFLFSEGVSRRMIRHTVSFITALFLLALFLLAPRGGRADATQFSPHQKSANPVLSIIDGDYRGPEPALSKEVKVGTSSAGYKKIRRRYRFLEFFSLGFLLVMAIIVTIYLLRIKGKTEKARKLRAETYSVEELDDGVSIAHHFEDLVLNRTTFTLQFEGIEGQFSTYPRSIQKGGTIFLTEALLPFPGKGMDLMGTNAKIEYLYNKVPYSFVTQLLSIPLAAEDPVAFRSPHLIKYTQRRHAFRVRPPVLEPVTTIFTHIGPSAQESVLDISTDGFSILSKKKYQPGATYREIRLTLPGLKPLKVDAKCVYHLPAASGEEKESLRLGFEFVGLGVKEEKTLMGFVSLTRGQKNDR